MVLSVQAEGSGHSFPLGFPQGLQCGSSVWVGILEEDSPFAPLSLLRAGYPLLWSCCAQIYLAPPFIYESLFVSTAKLREAGYHGGIAGKLPDRL